MLLIEDKTHVVIKCNKCKRENVILRTNIEDETFSFCNKCNKSCIKIQAPDLKMTVTFEPKRRVRKLKTPDGHTCIECPLKGSYCTYRRYKERALKSSKEFLIDSNYFWNMVKQPCKLCGIEPNPGKYNGIDRWDNTKGYILENCVTMCSQCNYAKGWNSPEQFQEWFMRVYEFNK